MLYIMSIIYFSELITIQAKGSAYGEKEQQQSAQA
jgi:hypothetical protein